MALHGAGHEQACSCGIEYPDDVVIWYFRGAGFTRSAALTHGEGRGSPGSDGLDGRLRAERSPLRRLPHGRITSWWQQSGDQNASVAKRKPIHTRLVRPSARARSTVSIGGAKSGKSRTLERRIAKGLRRRATAGLGGLMTQRRATGSVTHSERYGERAASRLRAARQLRSAARTRREHCSTDWRDSSPTAHCPQFGSRPIDAFYESC